MDKRIKNGGKRTNSGRPKINEEDRKVTVNFYVKKKHVAKAKKEIQPIVDKINKLS